MPIGKVKALDPGFTPTEHRQREQLLKQFTRLEGPSGNSKAFRESPMWCSWCEAHIKAPDEELCQQCLNEMKNLSS